MKYFVFFMGILSMNALVASHEAAELFKSMSWDEILSVYRALSPKEKINHFAECVHLVGRPDALGCGMEFHIIKALGNSFKSGKVHDLSLDDEENCFSSLIDIFKCSDVADVSIEALAYFCSAYDRFASLCLARVNSFHCDLKRPDFIAAKKKACFLLMEAERRYFERCALSSH